MRPRTAIEVADIVQRFLDGTSLDPWEWDDFISVPLADPALDSVRRRCAEIREEYPPAIPGTYCGPDGEDVLRFLIAGLREKSNRPM